MIAVIDANILLYLANPHTPAAADPETGIIPEGCEQRVNHLIATLSKSGAQLVIPTPALAEFLVGAGDAGPKWLTALQGKRVIRLAPFDEVAAVECAVMARKRAQAPKAVPRAKAKFDEQIVAIAITQRADVIYSDDRDIRKLAPSDIQVIGISELPLPPEDAQKILPYELPPENR